MTFSLKVEERTERGKKLGKLRASGKLPAVVYGPKESSLAITLDHAEFVRVFKQAGESNVITLDGFAKGKEVIVHEIAIDPLRNNLLHVDFYALEAGKEITIHVPLEFIGEAPAIKLGGTLTKVLHEVEVTCLPSKIPQHVTVDVSALVDFETQIHIKDIVVPEGVKIENDPEEVIVLAQAVAEEVLAESAPIDMDAIEVEKKGKTEEPEAQP